MKTRSLILLVFLNTILYSQEELFPGLAGDVLLSKIVEDYKPHTVLNYNEAREYMYETLQLHQDTIEGIYTGYKIYLPPNEPSRIWVFNNGINTEHIYPRSKGAHESNGNAFSDLHHLRPAKANVNSSRLNHPFREIDDLVTKKWFRSNQSTFDIPATDIDEYSELDSFVTSSGFILGDFEPRESVKGNIARAVFYFFTMYHAEALEADNNYFTSMKDDLCQWHVLDEADADEVRLTNLISEVQDGKANPFVLDCSLALRSYCANMNLECADRTTAVVELTKEDQIKLYPNPSDGIISLMTGREIKLKHIQIYNTSGQVMYSINIDHNQMVNQHLNLPSGLYTLQAFDIGGNYYTVRIIIH